MTDAPLRVWIVEVGEPLAIDPGNPKRMRASLLSEQCAMRGHDVTWFTSAFDHYRKRMRPTGDFDVRGDGWEYKITVLPALGYRRHISLARWRDHRRTASELVARAVDRRRPDVICAGLPTLDLAEASAKLADHFDTRLVIDVQDLWPDVIRDALPRPLRWAGSLLRPMRLQAERACNRADAIVGTSPTYVDWGVAQARRPRTEWDHPFPLTSDPPTLGADDLVQCEAYWSRLGVEPSTTVFAFVGSFSRHFSFDPVIEVIAEWSGRHPEVRFVLCGEGPKRDRIASRLNGSANCVMPGWVNAREATWLLRHAVAGLAPYNPIPIFEQNYTNKLLEYLSVGLPVVSSLRAGLQGSLLREEQCGFTYEPKDPSTLSNVLERLLLDKELRERTSRAAERVFADQFSTAKVYGAYAEYLGELADDLGASRSRAS
ncbi:MAG TPA: glycosyltransferase family 4 protein [Ilumatobacter sp.]|nr:glycosyltransferase family 4 protein [Ilumatobacter sp.]